MHNVHITTGALHILFIVFLLCFELHSIDQWYKCRAKKYHSKKFRLNQKLQHLFHLILVLIPCSSLCFHYVISIMKIKKDILWMYYILFILICIYCFTNLKTYHILEEWMLAWEQKSFKHCFQQVCFGAACLVSILGRPNICLNILHHLNYLAHYLLQYLILRKQYNGPHHQVAASLISRSQFLERLWFFSCLGSSLPDLGQSVSQWFSDLLPR